MTLHLSYEMIQKNAYLPIISVVTKVLVITATRVIMIIMIVPNIAITTTVFAIILSNMISVVFLVTFVFVYYPFAILGASNENALNRLEILVRKWA